MFLKTTLFTSNASRNIIKPSLKFNYTVKNLPLYFKLISKRGRNNLGRILCFTKKKWKNKPKFPLLNLNFRLKSLSLVISLNFLFKYSKFIALVYTLDNGFSYLPINTSIQLFNFIYFKSSLKKLAFLLPNPAYSFLYKVTYLTKVSFLEKIPGNGGVFVKSSGSFATLINFDMTNHTATVVLPSKIHKSFSIYSLVLLGSVSFNNKNLIINTKAGFWRNLGVKPKVRGIARNPVDHPHGGRTKSIKYPRTPWGKTTKYK